MCMTGALYQVPEEKSAHAWKRKGWLGSAVPAARVSCKDRREGCYDLARECPEMSEYYSVTLASKRWHLQGI